MWHLIYFYFFLKGVNGSLLFFLSEKKNFHSINMRDELFIKVQYLICLLMVFWLAVFETHMTQMHYFFSFNLLSFKEINNLVSSLKEAQKWCRLNSFSETLFLMLKLGRHFKWPLLFHLLLWFFFFKCMPLLAANSR